ncbi:MAG: hypothetical protein AUK28_05205 [Desulfobacterales bacterium CG2_30_60_27]|nr:MAG: hypothetical protein AUK28_05205 [Desulfobacterales bacterium CG2_30_60_27]
MVSRRVGLAQFLDYLGIAEPGRDLRIHDQVFFQYGVGIFASLQPLLPDAGHRHEPVTARHILHGFHRDDGDSQVAGVLPAKFMGLIRLIERDAAVTFGGRIGVLGADDHVGATEILVDDGVPEGLAGTGHSHGERQK